MHNPGDYKTMNIKRCFLHGLRFEITQHRKENNRLKASLLTLPRNKKPFHISMPSKRDKITGKNSQTRSLTQIVHQAQPAGGGGV